MVVLLLRARRLFTSSMVFWTQLIAGSLISQRLRLHSKLLVLGMTSGSVTPVATSTARDTKALSQTLTGGIMILR